MFDEKKQIVYWKTTALDNLETAAILLEKNKMIETLFFCHLCIEKLLKAHFVKSNLMLAPKSHDLLSLASKTKLTLDVLTEEFLGRLNEYNLEGRYPENYIKPPAREKVNDLYSKTKDLANWLMNQL
jgi:HEPN domain-containing protein